MDLDIDRWRRLRRAEADAADDGPTIELEAARHDRGPRAHPDHGQGCSPTSQHAAGRGEADGGGVIDPPLSWSAERMGSKLVLDEGATHSEKVGTGRGGTGRAFRDC